MVQKKVQKSFVKSANKKSLCKSPFAKCKMQNPPTSDVLTDPCSLISSQSVSYYGHPWSKISQKGFVGPYLPKYLGGLFANSLVPV